MEYTPLFWLVESLEKDLASVATPERASMGILGGLIQEGVLEGDIQCY